MRFEKKLKKISAPIAKIKNGCIFVPLLKKSTTKRAKGPFVYRSGLKIFILARGVRFPYGLPKRPVSQ